MEHQNDNVPDSDRKMMSSFERYADASEKKEKKSKKKKSNPPSLINNPPKEEVLEQQENREPGKAEYDLPQDADVEKLSDDETKLIAQTTIESRSEELKTDLLNANEGSLSEAEILSDAAFIENLSEKIGNSEFVNEELIDEVFTETLEEFELTDEAGEEVLLPEVDTDDDEEAGVLPPTQPPGGRGGSVPPPPTRPIPGTNSPSASSPTPASSLPLPESKPLATPEGRRSRGPDLLLGGVIGYLIGRRRGRIKTEARLLPIQEKLEREVKDLHASITRNEERIREAVRNQVESRPEIKEKIVERILTRTEKNKTEQKPIFLSRQERIGKLLIPRLETPESARTETITMSQALETAKQIVVEGVRLSDMYEAGRIDAKGLRKIVTEYLKGHEYKRTLIEVLRPLPVSPERLKTEEHSVMSMSAGVGYTASSQDSRVTVQTLGTNKPVTGSGALLKEQNHKKRQRAGVTLLMVLVVTILILVLSR